MLVAIEALAHVRYTFLCNKRQRASPASPTLHDAHRSVVGL